MRYQHTQCCIPRRRLSKESGISLLLTVIVLLVLTVIAITVTNSNQTQSILVRNNQLRLEAFNNSYTEIDAQIDVINQRSLSQGPPLYVNVLIDGNFNDRLTQGESGLELFSQAAQDADDQASDGSTPIGNITRDVAQVYRGSCQIFGEEIGVNTAGVVCNELRIDTNLRLSNTNINSSQSQVYEYRSLSQ